MAWHDTDICHLACYDIVRSHPQGCAQYTALRQLFPEFGDVDDDEIHLFKSKIIIGKHGKPAIVGKKLSQLNLSLNERKKFKDDIYTNYQVN